MSAPTPASVAGGPIAAVVDRDVISVSGPDAVTFLQGQLSQDVARLAVGESAWALLLQPQGKVDAWLRVTRTADDAVLLDLDHGWGAAALVRLNRFKLRTKADLTPLEGWRMVAVRGPGAEAVGAASAAAAGSDHVVVPARWPGVEGVDLLGAGVTVPAGATPVEASSIEAVRIASGVPAMGSELDDGTIPAEAGQWLIDASVSFTKGCYTGQELVARVDSRGSNTPRKLRRVRFAAGAVVAPGAELVVDGAAIGAVTSVASAEGIALAYVKRAVEPPVTATLAGSDLEATVEPLPNVD